MRRMSRSVLEARVRPLTLSPLDTVVTNPNQILAGGALSHLDKTALAWLYLSEISTSLKLARSTRHRAR